MKIFGSNGLTRVGSRDAYGSKKIIAETKYMYINKMVALMAKSPISSQFDKINPACTHGEFLEEKGPRLYQNTCNAVTHRWEEKLALCYLLC